MKKFLTLLAVLAMIVVHAQETVSTTSNIQQSTDLVNRSGALQRAGSAVQSQYGASAYFVNPARPVTGSIYLFDKWDNLAVLYASTGDKYRVNNININLKNQSYQSKFHQDSIFNFSFNNIDRFVINNKIYKNYYYNEDNRIYEILYETPEFTLLKGHKVNLVEGSANPMLNRKTDRYVQKHGYYLKTDKEIKNFKLKKKNILKLVGLDKSNSDEIMKFAKDNNLSFKNDVDLKRILEHAKSM
jgi:hypothetical protein